MNKYKYSRKKLANWVDELKKTYRGISNDGLELLKKDLLAKEPKPYLCCESRYCSKRFATIEELNDHKETHESDKESKWNDKQFDVPDVEENGTTKPKESKCECKCHREDKYTTMCSFCCQNHKCNNCGGMGCQMCEPKEDRWNDEFSWYPKKKMTPKPQEELEVEELKSHEGEETNGTRETIERLIAIIREHTDKQNELIKAHNALVKEVRG